MTSPVSVVETARRDPALVVLEGFHAVKHALRFGGDVTDIWAADVETTVRLADELAPDLVDVFASRTVRVNADELSAAAPRTPTGVVGVARRPRLDPERLMTAPADAPLVLLEDPRNLGNVGAVVRVAAAADVAGVLSTGRADPWDPAALRGSAGLHFALPVGQVESVSGGRPLVGFVPGGAPLTPAELPGDAILAFGTERTGLSPGLLDRCDARLALPMRTGVSSLNLATAVAAVLYAWRLSAAWPEH